MHDGILLPLSMKLQALIEDPYAVDQGGLPQVVSRSLASLDITKITEDSRQVIPGAIFVAVPGTKTDGWKFLGDAVERGAVILVGQGPDPNFDIPYLRVKESRRALAYLAAAWNGFPARQLVMIAVTGTDGKTTTTNLIYEILKAAGFDVGMISTLSAVIGQRKFATGFHVTTLGALDVQNYLAQMVTEGLTHCVLETTSHGLAQQRVLGCDFDLAVVTNITHEHLDYHGSFEQYRQAKRILFEGLKNSAPKVAAVERMAILNRDDSSFEYLRTDLGVSVLSYGLHQEADVRAQDVRGSMEGLKFDILSDNFIQPIESSLIGQFNVSNCLAAFSATVAGLQISPAIAAKGIAMLQSVPGRMQPIDLGQSFLAMVDFAHTPGSMRRVLKSARTLTHGKIIVIFGSAGLRDRKKRKMMAAFAAELADFVILTAEDPRTESLPAILEEMAKGAKEKGAEEGSNFWRIEDRGEAMRFAVRLAQPDDFVLALGKGHEQSMTFGEIEIPWDDRTALRAALAELLGIEGPAMPRLPTSAEEIRNQNNGI